MNPTRLMDRKEQIIELAAELVQARGFDSFSYNDLSQELGIRKASIHHHFARKEDLGVALCRGMADQFKQTMAKVEQTCPTAWDKLEALFGRATSMLEQGEVCPIDALRTSSNVLPEKMKAPLRSLSEQELDFITHIVEEGRNSGEMDFKGDPKYQAIIVLSTINEGLQYARLHGPGLFQQTLAQLRLNLQPR